ncbi:hypothetical protein [Paenibacillus ginsengihumi]|uniref:hypothetical protein n=1 Tax=Paenibacillus ginsengihumi TaxID=431596 RepID=UPI00036BA7BB|nr:hypothetical protein [Paenibacillus ginsengihumi]
MLLQEGYREEAVIERESAEGGLLFLYPYSLYDRYHKRVDRLFHAEYCMKDEHGEWEEYKSFWTRSELPL